jgi:N-acetylneuraminic acid mutarotase
MIDRWYVETFLTAALAVSAIGMAAIAQGDDHSALDKMDPMLKIEWRLGPDYPMGIQESSVGCIGGKIVSAGGFTRHPLDVCKKYPQAFGGQPSGFTSLAFVFDPKTESAGWQRIADMPGPARQGPAVAVVDNMLYIMGGLNYTKPFTYRETYRLQEKAGQWVWQELPSCRLPWPVYGSSGSTAIIGKKIYLFGAADSFQGPGADGNDFHSEAGRDGSPVGRALLVLDTANVETGWKRLADCPGVPKFDSAVAAAGGKLYHLGGIFAPLAKKEMPYYNAVDSWSYGPAVDRWTRLRDMPHGANRRALVYHDRYVVLVAGYKYPHTWNLDGTTSKAYSDAEKARAWETFFEKTVLVFDTQTGRLGTADPLIEQTSIPSSTIVGDTMYCLGGEGGPRLFHPATLQIGRIVEVIPQ